MVGIIYKFTILTHLKRDGAKPFYVGQHWSNEDVNHFLRKDCHVYDGSGVIWVDYIKNLKNEYPKNWRKLIRREILCIVNKYDEKLLNKLEKYFIKHEKAHYSYKSGGCNILWGAAIEHSPAKDPLVKDKLRKANLGKTYSEETKRKLSELKRGSNHWAYGKTFTDEHRKKLSLSHIGKRSGRKGKQNSKTTREKISISNTGKRRTDDFKIKRSNEYLGENNPFYGKTHSNSVKLKLSKDKKNRIWINNGIQSKFINSKLPIPIDWHKGRIYNRRIAI